MQQLPGVDIDPTGQRLVYSLTPAYLERQSFSLSRLGNQNYAGQLYEYALGSNRPSVPFGDIGWAMAGFSPDGTRLAVHFSDNGILKAGVWDFAEKKFYPLRVTPEVGSAAFGAFERPIWLSRDELLYFVKLDPRPAFNIDTRRAIGNELVFRWKNAWEGKVPSATVLDSPLPEQPPGDRNALVKVTVSTGTATVISAGAYGSITLSPDGKRILATRASGPRPFDPNQEPGIENWPQRGYEAVLIDLAQQSMTDIKTSYDIVGNTFAWNREGTRFVVYGQPKAGGVGAWLLGDVATASVIPVPHIGLDLCSERARGQFHVPEQAFPFGDGVALAARAQSDPKGTPQFTLTPPGQGGLAKTNWYLVEPDGSSRILTEKIDPMSPVVASVGKDVFYATGAGRLWRIPLEGEPTALTGTDTNIYFRRRYSPAGGQLKELHENFLVCLDRNPPQDAPKLFVDLTTGRAQPIKLENNAGRLASISTAAQAIVVATEGKGDWSLRVSRVDGKTETLQTFNQHLSEVKAPERIPIAYQLADGKKVTGQAVLPVDYQKGQRRPVVVSIYPTVSSHRAGYESGYLALMEEDFYSSLGYIVLYPFSDSVSLKKGDNPIGNWAGVTMPAVDKLIEMGYADPDRLAATGFSQGSWSVLALVTQTNRFKAASAGCGYSNFVSAFNEQPLSTQVSSVENWGITQGTRFEIPGAYPTIGGTPWDEPMKYIEASPLFGVRRIETPLLLTHADMDIFPMAQFDELFTAMTRLKKRVQYVRYWGEDHGPASPANIRDYWARQIAWFDEFCDVSRDANGAMLFDGDRIKSRHGAASLSVDDILKWEWFFGPAPQGREP